MACKERRWSKYRWLSYRQNRKCGNSFVRELHGIVLKSACRTCSTLIFSSFSQSDSEFATLSFPLTSSMPQLPHDLSHTGFISSPSVSLVENSTDFKMLQKIKQHQMVNSTVWYKLPPTIHSENNEHAIINSQVISNAIFIGLSL